MGEIQIITENINDARKVSMLAFVTSFLAADYFIR